MNAKDSDIQRRMPLLRECFREVAERASIRLSQPCLPAAGIRSGAGHRVCAASSAQAGSVVHEVLQAAFRAFVSWARSRRAFRQGFHGPSGIGTAIPEILLASRPDFLRASPAASTSRVAEPMPGDRGQRGSGKTRFARR